jgi:membrane fusion protein, copper/silver efflux system
MPKTIKIGSGNKDYLTIISGLNDGDIVVTRGAYLLNSEAIFKDRNDNMTSGKCKSIHLIS